MKLIRKGCSVGELKVVSAFYFVMVSASLSFATFSSAELEPTVLVFTDWLSIGGGGGGDNQKVSSLAKVWTRYVMVGLTVPFD